MPFAGQVVHITRLGARVILRVAGWPFFVRAYKTTNNKATIYFYAHICLVDLLLLMSLSHRKKEPFSLSHS